MNENAKVVTEVPSFLKEPALTKPDENAKHFEKLLEMAKAMDEEEAAIVCGIFARKYPNVMLLTLSAEINSLRLLRDEVSKSYETYNNMKEVS